MTLLEHELTMLKRSIMSMMMLVKSQLESSKEAIDNFNKDLALEIIEKDIRVDTCELKNDQACENILALYQPVAIDLRFVLACFKINTILERVGDNVCSLAKLTSNLEQRPNPVLRTKLRFDEMLEGCVRMVEDCILAYENEDCIVARKLFQVDRLLNEIHGASVNMAVELIREFPENTKDILILFAGIKKMERIGDLSKNICEEIIFYLEAKVLKHSKKKDH